MERTEKTQLLIPKLSEQLLLRTRREASCYMICRSFARYSRLRASCTSRMFFFGQCGHPRTIGSQLILTTRFSFDEIRSGCTVNHRLRFDMLSESIENCLPS